MTSFRPMNSRTDSPAAYAAIALGVGMVSPSAIFIKPAQSPALTIAANRTLVSLLLLAVAGSAVIAGGDLGQGGLV